MSAAAMAHTHLNAMSGKRPLGSGNTPVDDGDWLI